MEWTGSGQFADAVIPSRTANGFALLELADDRLTESFTNQNGTVRRTARWESARVDGRRNAARVDG